MLMFVACVSVNSDFCREDLASHTHTHRPTEMLGVRLGGGGGGLYLKPLYVLCSVRHIAAHPFLQLASYLGYHLEEGSCHPLTIGTLKLD